MADLLPNGFIWTLFCPDLDQSIFEVSQARQMSVCHISSQAFGLTGVERERFECIGNAFGSTGVKRERISTLRKRIWIDGRRGLAYF